MLILDIIKRSLKLTGLLSGNQNLRSEDAIDTLAELNGILNAWNIEKLKSFNQVDIQHTLVSGQDVYTIGVGGDIDSARPKRIETMLVRDNNIDYPLSSISFDEYQNIRTKDISSTYPRYFYYNPEHPLGVITLYPKPSKALTLNITQWYLWSNYESTADVIDIPTEFVELLVYELAINICPYFGKQVPGQIVQRHADLEYNINNNTALQWLEHKNTDVPTAMSNNNNGFRTYIPTPFR